MPSPSEKTFEEREPNNDEVICPGCVHQFRAIPVNVQDALRQCHDSLHGWEDAPLHVHDAITAAQTAMPSLVGGDE